MILLIILIFLITSYIGFIIVPAVLLYRFVFGRKPCSTPLNERGTLEGTRYAPFSEALLPAERFVQSREHESVSITARDGVVLCGSYYDQKSPRTMIFAHGYAGAPVSNFCAQAERFYKLGWNLLFITERAHGDSGGNRLGLGVLEQYDLLKWIDFEARNSSVEEIVLYGSSMGSAAVGYASDKITEPKVKVLVIDCAFVSPDRQLRCDGRTRKLPTFLLLPVMRVIAWFDMHEDIYRPVGKSLQNTHIPVLFIHGEADRTVPIEQGMENYKACGSENVSPAELEAHFNALPFIQDSQVFEDVAENGKHILALEVVPRQTVLSKMDLENPKEYIISELEKVNLTLPSFERVNRIEVRDSDFERTPSMKIARYKKC